MFENIAASTTISKGYARAAAATPASIAPRPSTTASCWRASWC
ncbi:hypothetical protein ACRAWD_31970 [Caulobacter segnis]